MDKEIILKQKHVLIYLVFVFFSFAIGYISGGGFSDRVIITHPTEYYFNVDNKGYDIYTEDMKLVGRINYGDNPTLDSLIDLDNQ